MSTESKHVHKFRDDSAIGENEEVCSCGYWRCHYLDGRNGRRCEAAAVGISQHCASHRQKGESFCGQPHQS